MNKKKYILFGLVGVMAVLTIFSTISSVTTGIEMSALNKKEKDLISIKRELEENFIKTTSTKELMVKSVELGFAEISSTIYLTKVDSVASLP